MRSPLQHGDRWDLGSEDLRASLWIRFAALQGGPSGWLSSVQAVYPIGILYLSITRISLKGMCHAVYTPSHGLRFPYYRCFSVITDASS